MSFQPVISGNGPAGWKFLQRTYDTQFKAFNASPVRNRDAEYFTKAIANVKSAADLVADRRLLSVALGAFGLQDDINNKYFIQKILEDGTTAKDSLANRLSDGRYRKLSEAFGFGPQETVKTGNIDAMIDMAKLHDTQSFEAAVGEINDSMRIALFAERELADLSTKDVSEDTKWFTLMSLPPLRQMFETALGLPSAFGQLDIDKQLQTFKEKITKVTGNASIEQFSDPVARERMTALYLARSQINAMQTTFSPSANSLMLLRGY